MHEKFLCDGSDLHKPVEISSFVDSEAIMGKTHVLCREHRRMDEIARMYKIEVHFK
ncbi:hypothetical protein PAECIP111802_02400 [Paenibacillus allorhizosphaerae]|uniref:Uncharacterized protein n=1 Tax=Paenibacillus allorhizosphaerae TaxID=2849866 RepID=A0ABN7TJE6_9BACL|nr:hypothetical protein PAECIP111802_02400 [Paenibacillus allorhizosphaerae]